MLEGNMKLIVFGGGAVLIAVVLAAVMGWF